MDVRKLKYATVAWLSLQVMFLFGAWSVLLFFANPPTISWKDNLEYLLSDESELKSVFFVSNVIIVGSVIAIISYLKGWADYQMGKWLLFLLVSVIAIPAVYWMNWHSAVPFVAAPIFAFLFARFGSTR